MKPSSITLKNVPPQLHKALKESAKKHKRSMNQEAIYLLEAALKANEQHSTSLRDLPVLKNFGGLRVSEQELNARATDLLDNCQ